MFKRRFFTIMITTGLLALPAQASDFIKEYIPSPQTVGKGRLSVMFWDVYDAQLMAPQGEWKNEGPFALQLSYLREIEGKKIASKSVEEMRKLGYENEIKLADWHSQMCKIFPDVREGVTLTGVYTENHETIFFENNQMIGRITDPEFGHLFFDIWLSEKTSAPSLRQKLLGSL